jgi:thiol-disulfide isomerase/thioredoxin
MKPRSLFTFAAAAILTFGAFAAAPAANDPSMTFKSHDGASHSLSELRGHPAVVNFWATWCGPCKEEMPRLQKLSESYKDQGVHFVAISLDAPETQSKIDPLLAKRDFHIPVWTGATDRTLSQLELGVLVPATLILDDKGEVIGKIEGEARDKDIRSRLDWVLGGRKGQQPKILQKNDW